MSETPDSFSGLVEAIIDFINLLIPALFGFVFIYIIWKLIDAWVIHADDEKKQADGRRLVLVGVLVLVLMIITWGIIAILKESFFG